MHGAVSFHVFQLFFLLKLELRGLSFHPLMESLMRASCSISKSSFLFFIVSFHRTVGRLL